MTTRKTTSLLLALAALLCAGCVSQTVKRVNSVPANNAETEIAPAKLLNVNVAVFDPGLPPKSQQPDPRLFPEVRKAEARFMPYTLRTTLQNTGQWGAVRVVPEPIPTSELLVTGKILHSDGETLVLRIHAEDATGRTWLDKTYSAQAAELSYDNSEQSKEDPFQDLYNRIANDLVAKRNQLSTQDTRNVQQVAKLRFDAELAPKPFADYLQKKNGRYQVVGLPAEGDPIARRLTQIRQRDYRLIDALDQHYRLFHQQIALSYDDWRASSYKEVREYDQLRKQSLGRKVLGALAVVGGLVAGANARTNTGAAAANAAIIGGALIFKSGLDKGSEARIHAEAVKELGHSLEGDLKPRVVQLAGQTVTLSGSAKAQYDQWRKLLRQMYANETGFIDASQTPVQTTTPDAH